MKRFILLLGLLSTPLAATASVGHEVPSPANEKAVLGQGYHSTREGFMGKCVTDSAVQYAGAPTAFVEFSRSLSRHEMQESLGFSAGGFARFGLTSASASAQFAKQASADSYSETTTYASSYAFKNAVFANPKLNELGQRVYGSGASASDTFAEICGNEYVAQVQLGAKLLINARFDFSSREEKERFQAEVEVKGPAFGMEAAMQHAAQHFSGTSTITISAFQLGGNVNRLSTIFSRPKAERNGDGKREINALLRCSMTDIKACQEVWNQALDYATSDDDKSFINQIKDEYDPTKPGGLAELMYITKPYSNIGALVKPAIVAGVLEAKRKTLSLAFERYLGYLNRVQALQAKVARLTTPQALTLAAYDKHVQETLTDIGNVASVCWGTDDESCPARVDAALAAIDQSEKAIGFQLEAFNIVPHSFGQWCDFVGYASKSVPSPSLQKTADAVELLVDYARSIMTRGQSAELWDKVEDKCGFIESILSMTDTIGLAGKPFLDLRPLAELTNLRFLTLRKAGLGETAETDLAHLAGLKNLVKLDLSDNSIADVHPLAGLSKLQALLLTSNHIADFSPLGSIRGLRFLDGTNNPESAENGAPLCPIDGECRLDSANVVDN